MLFGYVTYDVQNKEEAFRRVSLALQVMNGEDEILDVDDEGVDF